MLKYQGVVRGVKHLFSLWLSLLSADAFSDTIVGELIFERRPPMAAVVFVRDPGAGLQPAVLDQKDRDFTSKMVLASPGQEVLFRNSDSAKHNIYANSYETGKKFNVGMMAPGEERAVSVDWPEDKMVRIGCSLHTRMEAYIANIRTNHSHVFSFQRQSPRRGASSEYSYSSYYRKNESGKATLNESFVLKEVSSVLSEVSLIMPYRDEVRFELKAGERKSIVVNKGGIDQGLLVVSRVMD